jgi:hypothetical protein
MESKKAIKVDVCTGADARLARSQPHTLFGGGQVRASSIFHVKRINFAPGRPSTSRRSRPAAAAPKCCDGARRTSHQMGSGCQKGDRARAARGRKSRGAQEQAATCAKVWQHAAAPGWRRLEPRNLVPDLVPAVDYHAHRTARRCARARRPHECASETTIRCAGRSSE